MLCMQFIMAVSVKQSTVPLAVARLESPVVLATADSTGMTEVKLTVTVVSDRNIDKAFAVSWGVCDV